MSDYPFLFDFFWSFFELKAFKYDQCYLLLDELMDKLGFFLLLQK